MPNVLITGASRGIGLVTAEELAKEGYKVYATTRNPDEAHELQALAKQYPDNIIVKPLDVTTSPIMIKAALVEIKDIDILINNAGIGVFGPDETVPLDKRREVYEVNVFGLSKVTEAVLPGMRVRSNKDNSCRIISLSSVVGPLPNPYLPTYSATKAAVESYTAVLRKNLKDAGHNIIVANIHPGPVLTDFEQSTPRGNQFTVENNPYPQMAADEEKWRSIMRNGCPVEETVKTILRVINEKNPHFWNPTNAAVEKQFARVYHDTTGANYMAGLTVPKPVLLEPANVSARKGACGYNPSFQGSAAQRSAGEKRYSIVGNLDFIFKPASMSTYHSELLVMVGDQQKESMRLSEQNDRTITQNLYDLDQLKIILKGMEGSAGSNIADLIQQAQAAARPVSALQA